MDIDRNYQLSTFTEIYIQSVSQRLKNVLAK